jgi:hypothetical protein
MRGLNQQAVAEKSKTAPEKTGAGNRFVQKIGRAVPKKSFGACFENIPGGLAAGRGVWLRCSSVTDF